MKTPFLNWLLAAGTLAALIAVGYWFASPPPIIPLTPGQHVVYHERSYPGAPILEGTVLETREGGRYVRIQPPHGDPAWVDQWDFLFIH